MKLKVNREKSQAGSPLKLKFPGFSMCHRRGKMSWIRPHEKSVKSFSNRIRELTSRKQGKTIPVILRKLKEYTTGRIGYYGISDMKQLMEERNQRIRRRIRQIYRKQWKRIKARKDNLVKLGVRAEQARQWANTRLGYWRVAGSWILTTSLTNERLARLGYDDISQRYETLRLSH